MPGPDVTVLEVTVIVPCREAEDTLEACLASLCSQRPGLPFEIVVVENDSPDACLAIARRAEAARPDLVRVVRELLPGAYRARNRGIDAARGRILLFTDADCEAEPGWIVGLAEALADPAVLAVGGEVVAAEGQSALAARYARAAGILEQRRTLAHPRGPFLQTASLGVRASDARALGGFDPTLRSGGDADFCWRLRERAPGRSLRLVPGARVRHHHRETVRGFYRQFRRYGRGDVALARRYPEGGAWVRAHALGKVGADVLRLVGLPLLLAWGALLATLRWDALPLAAPILRAIQLLARRAGQLEALSRRERPPRPRSRPSTAL